MMGDAKRLDPLTARAAGVDKESHGRWWRRLHVDPCDYCGARRALLWQCVGGSVHADYNKRACAECFQNLTDPRTQDGKP